MENSEGFSGITEIKHNGELFALIIGKDFSPPGIRFLTAPELPQQLGYMSHPAGHVIAPHSHNAVRRVVLYTQEVLVIRRGCLRVDFYLSDRTYWKSCALRAGDVIVLIAGGHGFEVLEDVEMLEIKQGPYVGEADKTRFSPAPESTLRFDD